MNDSSLYNLAVRYQAAGRFAESEATLRRLLARTPDDDDAHVLLGDALLLQGRAEAALVEYEKEADPAARLCSEAMAYHALGRAKASASAVHELVAAHSDHGKAIAEVHAFRGEADQAFARLERAYEAHDPDLVYLKPDPFLKRLHGDPRWGALLKRIGLPGD